MKDVRDDTAETLRFMGYGEVRFRGGRWRPLGSVNGELGTTAETEIHDPKKEPTCRLVDGETGEQIGTARLSCPINAQT